MAQVQVTRYAGKVERQPLLQMGARVGRAVIGVVHLIIGWLAFQVAWSVGTAPADQSGALQALTRSEAGRVTLWVSVVGFLALGLWQLGRHPGALATRAGVIGYIAKGVALCVVGVLFFLGAAQNSALKTTGLDGAQRTLREQPQGPWLLTAVALGIAVYGVYSFARAKHARV